MKGIDTKSPLFKTFIYWMFSLAFIYGISFFPWFIQNFYFENIYPIIAIVNRWFYRLFSFSVGDVIYILGIGYLFYLLIEIILHIRKPLPFLLKLSNYLLQVVWLFYLSWGFNYFRPSLSETLHFNNDDYTLEQLKNVTNTIIDKSNELQLNITKNDTLAVDVPYGISHILRLTPIGYQKIEDKIHQKYRLPCIKESLLSSWISYLHTTGYLNPFTGESQINYLYPKSALPFIASHEVAHQLGYAPEDEANFLGFLSSINNPDPYFKYSGYTSALYYLLIELHKADNDAYKESLKHINKGIIKNFREESRFYHRYNLRYDMTKVYDSYLKLNQQKKGIHSYNDMVRLLIGYYK